MATMVSIGQITIADMNDGLSIVLSNSSHLVPADASGVVTSFAGASTTVMVMQGAVDVTSSWTLSKVDTSCTSALAASTVTVSALSADVGYVDITATRSGWPSLKARFTVTKAKQGVTGNAGSAGADASSYWITKTAAAIGVNGGGGYNPASVTFSAYRQTGVAAPALYPCRFIIATSIDGSTWVDSYTSAADESSKAYTPAAGLRAVRCRMYLAGGTTSMLDEETVPMVADGIGLDLCDTTWWSPTAPFRWTKADDITTGETSIVWDTGLKGQQAPLMRAVADSVNKCYQPECAGGGLQFWFPCMTVTGTANTSVTIDTANFLTAPSSYKMTKATLATIAHGIASKAVPVVAGQVYTVRVSVRSDQVTAGGIYAVINQSATLPASGAVNESNRSGFTALISNQPAATTLFQSYTTYTYTVPTGVTAISIGVYSGANGPLNLWLDDPIIALSSLPISTIGPRQSVDGGYNASSLNTIGVNASKTYRFIVPVRINNDSKYCQVYFGPENGAKVCTLNTATVTSNPYWTYSSSDVLTDSKWYLMVGYIYPAGSTGATSNDAGIYDVTTGQKVVAGTNFCFAAGVTSIAHRAYQYYADNGSLVYFGAPMVHCVDGSEPMLRTWMAATTSDIAKNAVNETTKFSPMGGFGSWTALVQYEIKTMNCTPITVPVGTDLHINGYLHLTMELPAAASTVAYIGYWVDVYFTYTGSPAPTAPYLPGPNARLYNMHGIAQLVAFNPVSLMGNSRTAKFSMPVNERLSGLLSSKVVTPVVRLVVYYLTSDLQPTTTPEQYAGSIISNTESYMWGGITEWVSKA